MWVWSSWDLHRYVAFSAAERDLPWASRSQEASGHPGLAQPSAPSSITPTQGRGEPRAGPG